MSKLLQLYIGGYGEMITVLHRGGYAQMITILHGGGGVSRNPQKWLRNMCTTPNWIMLEKKFKSCYVWNLLRSKEEGQDEQHLSAVSTKSKKIKKKKDSAPDGLLQMRAQLSRFN